MCCGRLGKYANFFSRGNTNFLSMQYIIFDSVFSNYAIEGNTGHPCTRYITGDIKPYAMNGQLYTRKSIRTRLPPVTRHTPLTLLWHVKEAV